jgi:CheY-like chemotaxis protein
MTTFLPRSMAELERDRQANIAAWRAAAEGRERIESARRENRQVQTEARRRIEALRRANTALLAQSDHSIRESIEILDVARPRAVLVHRQEWVREQLRSALLIHGMEVIAVCDDGADCLGISVAEQPDLVVVEARLPSIPAVELLSSLRQFSPWSLLAAQVESDEEVEAMLAAGARAVFHRRVPAAQACAQLAGYLRERPDDLLLLR